MLETLPPSPVPGAHANAWIFAQGARVIAWTPRGDARVVDPATGRTVLEVDASDRVVDADPSDTLLLRHVRREGAPTELQVWVVGDDVRRLCTLEARPRPWFASVRRSRVITMHGGSTLGEGHRMQFDPTGRCAADEPIALVDRQVMSIWYALTDDDRSLFRAAPSGDILVSSGGVEREIAGPVRRVATTESLYVRGSFDASQRRLVVVFRALGHARVVDPERQALVSGPWDEPGVSEAFFCGEHLVVARPRELRVYVGAELVLARGVEEGARVARLDTERVVIAGSASLEVVDVSRGERVASAPVPGAAVPARLIAGDGLICVIGAEGALTMLRVG